MNSEQSGVFVILPNPYALLLCIVHTLCKYNVPQDVVEVYEVCVHAFLRIVFLRFAQEGERYAFPLMMQMKSLVPPKFDGE
jgi:hypothetical protein